MKSEKESLFITPSQEKHALMLIGLPGCGKTTWVAEHVRGFVIVDADKIKETHPQYDPKDPSIVHQWSVKEAETDMNLLAKRGVPVCLDGGGVNNHYSMRIMNMLKENGYKITLIYFNVPTWVCAERNKKRERVVPDTVILEKSEKLFDSYARQYAIADERISVNENGTYS